MRSLIKWTAIGAVVGLVLAAGWLPAKAPDVPTHSAVEAAVAALNPDALSPREALDALYSLKKLGEKL